MGRTPSIYDYSAIRKTEDLPKEPHWGLMVFTTRTEWTPPYDHHDGDGTSSSIPTMDYYAFKELSELEAYLSLQQGYSKDFQLSNVRVIQVGSVSSPTVSVKVEIHTNAPR